MSKDESKEKGVDLGLRDLISSLNGELSVTQSSKEIGASEEISTAEEASSSAETFSELFENQKFDELITRAEADIKESNNQDLAARYWWLNAHASKSDIPYQILKATAESLANDAEIKSEVKLQLLIRSLITKLDEQDIRKHQDDDPKGSEDIRSSIVAKIEKEFRTPIKTIGTVLLLAGLIWMLKDVIFEKQALPLNTELSPDQEAKLIAPEVAATDLKTAMDAVSYTLDAQEYNNKPAVTSSPASTPQPAATQTSIKKEPISTDGPKESENRIMREPPRSAPQLPETSKRVAEQDEDYRDPFDAESVAGKGYRKQKGQESFFSERSLRVIRRAEVFSDPSARSEKVATVYDGDIVYAEGREGAFYRVRSRKGKIGFIHEGDVAEIKQRRW